MKLFLINKKIILRDNMKKKPTTMLAEDSKARLNGGRCAFCSYSSEGIMIEIRASLWPEQNSFSVYNDILCDVVSTIRYSEEI